MQFRLRSIASMATLLLMACAQHPPQPYLVSSDAPRAPMSALASPDQAPQTVMPSAADTGIQPSATQVPTTKLIKVGLLLPLTGRNAELGRAMQDAATVSLFDKYARLPLGAQGTKIELLPKDTGDSPQFAQAAMASALKDGAELIIGPVFADATESAAPLAAAKNVSVLSFSNNHQRALAANTYLLGFSPREQAIRVVNYALAHEKKRIAVLVPKSPLGDEVLAAAQDAAKAAGVALVATAQYAPQGLGMDTAMHTLMPSNAPNFDTLLLADGGPSLETVLRSLSARGVSNANVQFLGTGVWDDAHLLQRMNLDGAWFASSDPALTVQFEERFRSTYKYTPPRIASLSYDAVALAVALGTSGRAYSAENLTAKAGYVGPANGIFRLKPDGSTQRGLAVIEVNGSSLKVISPAPTGFPAN